MMNNRRTFLRASGVCLALPMLESFAKTETKKKFNNNAKAKRLVCVGSNLGYSRPAFYPKETGKGYKASQLLSFTDKHREHYTVFSGLDHRAGNGHGNWDNFLCGNKIGSTLCSCMPISRVTMMGVVVIAYRPSPSYMISASPLFKSGIPFLCGGSPSRHPSDRVLAASIFLPLNRVLHAACVSIM